MKKNFPNLGYCSNIHKYEDFAELLTVLVKQSAKISKGIKDYLPKLSVGLYLSAKIADELLEDSDKINKLRLVLQKNNLQILSLNCFPYANFHQEIVKEQVYFPHWGNRERLEFTKKAALILEKVLPVNVCGTISTVPICYGKDLPLNAVGHLHEMMEFLQKLSKKIILTLEPEPFCFLDSTQSIINFFRNFSISERRLLGICFDVSHFSSLFENPITAYKKLQKEKILIPKIQFSAAIKGETAYDFFCLQKFIDKKYLHQTTIRNGEENFLFRDISDVFYAGFFGEFCTHFHIPIFLSKTAFGLKTTKPELFDFIKYLAKKNNSEKIYCEVETYSLNQIPQQKMSATVSTIKELLSILKLP